MPVTDVIASTEALLTETTRRLADRLTGESASPWGVELFSGTSYERLFEYIPEVMTKHQGKPVAVAMYAGSSYDCLPRRKASVAVLLLVETPQMEAGAVDSRKMLDRCLTLLDEHISGRIKWEAREDAAVDIGPNVECIKVVFEARDT